MRWIIVDDDEHAEIAAAVNYRIDEIIASGDDVPKSILSAQEKIRQASRSSTPDLTPEGRERFRESVRTVIKSLKE